MAQGRIAINEEQLDAARTVVRSARDSLAADREKYLSHVRNVTQEYANDAEFFGRFVAVADGLDKSSEAMRIQLNRYVNSIKNTKEAMAAVEADARKGVR